MMISARELSWRFMSMGGATSQTPTTRRRSVSTLILLRHGQSQWNGPDSRFSGWCDVPLTVRGRVEAVASGQLLRSKGFKASKVDVAFTSELQRAHETCELALASMAGPEQHTWCPDRIRRDWRLNERHYGLVQGLYKNDAELLQTYSQETVISWRRSMYETPPPLDESHEYWMPPPAPLTESLYDCQQRAIECFETRIAPALFEEEGLPTPPDERTVVVVAHSNTIRSLMAAFDQVPEELVPKLHVPNSVPILYKFDRETRKPVSNKLQAAAGGSHARWLVSAENHRAVRKALQDGGLLTRALFDSFDSDGNGALTSEEIRVTLRLFAKEEEEQKHPVDCVVLALAKKIGHEMSPQESISLKDFEFRVTQALEGLQVNGNDCFVEHEPFP